jgi:DnaJ-domain-containing protein 1
LDPIIDRFGRLIRSYLQDEGTAFQGGDQDLHDAWNELNSFLNEDDAFDAALHGKRERESGSSSTTDTNTGTSFGSKASGFPPESLRQDYANLEVPFGSSDQKVRESYKRLMREYHPDRHGGDAERMRIATEIAQKINGSYQRIRRFVSTGSVD